MHDIKWIRENPEAFDQGLRRRGLPPQAADVLALDQEHRRLRWRQHGSLNIAPGQVWSSQTESQQADRQHA